MSQDGCTSTFIGACGDFCFSDREADEIDAMVAKRVPNGTGDYAGTLYPAAMSLSKFTTLYYRIKQINFNMSCTWRDHSMTTEGPAIPEGIDTSDPDESIFQRACGDLRSLKFTWQYTHPDGSSQGGGTVTEDWEDYVTFYDTQYSFYMAPRLLVEGNAASRTCYGCCSGTRRAGFHFSVGVYNGYWTTYYPHIKYDVECGIVHTFTGKSKKVSVNIGGSKAFTMTVYQIITGSNYRDGEGNCAYSTYGGDATFTSSDWDVELVDKPRGC